MIEIKPLTEPADLSYLLRTVPGQPFLQSWAWGEFQQAYGRRIWRLGAYDGASLVGAMTIIEHRLILGKTYLYVPRGPVATNPEVAADLWQAAKEKARAEGAIYVKIDPPIYGWAPKVTITTGYQPGRTLQEPDTLVLDLRPSPEELMAAMHHKTRYNIRLAERHGVKVRWSTTDDDYEQYLALQKEMAARQGIRPHPDRYYRVMFDVFRQAKMGELAVAELDGQPLAINLIVWHEQTAVFIHGGSTHDKKEMMAPYLVQWTAIGLAKERGMKEYDFRGIAPENQPDHKLAGVTRFKLGFGGRRVVFPPAQNAVINRPWWLAYRLARQLRGGGVE